MKPGHDERPAMTASARHRLRTSFAAVVATMLLAGAAAACAQDSPEPTNGAEAPPHPPLTAGPPSEHELEPGWDQLPDGVSPAPVEELSEAALSDLLRTRAQAAARSGTCAPEAVEVGLVGFDAALGHRFTSLHVRNTSERICELNGVPGIGARGQWGNAFTLTVQPAPTNSVDRGPATLAPGQEAVAVIEWTGILAGAEDEKASTLVVQLARGQVPIAVPVQLQGGSADAGPLDLGMLTTLRVGPFIPANHGRLP